MIQNAPSDKYGYSIIWTSEQEKDVLINAIEHQWIYASGQLFQLVYTLGIWWWCVRLLHVRCLRVCNCWSVYEWAGGISRIDTTECRMINTALVLVVEVKCSADTGQLLRSYTTYIIICFSHLRITCSLWMNGFHDIERILASQSNSR